MTRLTDLTVSSDDPFSRDKVESDFFPYRFIIRDLTAQEFIKACNYLTSTTSPNNWSVGSDHNMIFLVLEEDAVMVSILVSG